MADQDTTIPQMDDRELFQSTMEPEPKAETQQEPEPASQERPRDEQGRFAPKQEQVEPVKAKQPLQAAPTPADPTKDEGGQVPSWRLREVSEARQAAERRAEDASRQAYAIQQQMAEMRRQMEAFQKPKSEPTEFFANPDQAIQERLSPIEERFAQLESRMRLNSSRAMAVVMHGKETVAEMEQTIAKAIDAGHPEMQALSMRMRQSDDPVGIAVDWFKHHKVISETGGDLASYKAKLLEEAMKDPAFQAKAMETWRGTAQQQAAQPGARPNIQLPPSINRATGSGASNAGSDDIDINDGRAMFNYANAGKSGRR